MYNFSHFKENDQAEIIAFLKKYPFAFLTGSTLAGSQVATQLPMLVEFREDELYLKGHIMRKTDHHKAFIENPEALLVFTGPQSYVSATWYSNPQNGSTWNYMSVHISGKIRFMDKDELIDVMKKTTLLFEKDNENSPTIYDNLPDSYLNKMMPAIVGIEIKAEKIDNVFKLSQNRDKESYLNVIKKLQSQGGQAAEVAQEMEKRKDHLFPQ